MNILWDDSVYPFIEISEVVKPPYRVSDFFIEAVKSVIKKLFPSNLSKDDGTKILIIEKDTAIMGDLFFGHVDSVSRRLFDLSPIQEKFSSSPMASCLPTKYKEALFSFYMSFISIEIIIDKKLVKMKSSFMLMLPLLFNLNLSFSQHQHLHVIDNFTIKSVDWQ